jgi:Zn-dependent protease with chaperone function
MGAPLAVLLTPLAVLFVGLTLRFMPGGQEPLELLVSAARFIPRAIEAALDTDRLSSLLGPRPLLAFAMLLAPGMAALFGLWLLLRIRFAHSGVGGMILGLGARPPQPNAVEEVQLGNVIEEMAIAAGMTPPALRVLDDDAPNAAAVGSGEDDATIVVSRAVLARLDRDGTQAVAGHLLGSIASGDLRILASLNAVFECAGLAILVLDAVFGLSPSAFRDLARVLKLIAGGGDAAESAEAQKLLVTMTGEVREDGIHHVSEGPTVKKYPFLNVFLMPFLLLNVVNLMLKWQTYLIRSIFVGPMVMLVWRRRRFHADAVAVQLTRNPEALAKGLAALSMDPELLSRASWAEPLFVVGAPGGGWSRELGGIGGSHPPLGKRLARIAAMGGRAIREPERSYAPRPRWTAASLVLVPLAALVVPLMGVVVVLSFFLAAFPALLVTLVELAIVVAILT